MTIRSRAVGIRSRAERYAAAAEASRQDHGTVDALYVMFDRDSEIGGGIMAGSLAYRLFIWFLPFSLVVVAGIGIGADVASESPASAARSLGLRGVVSKSIAEASQTSSRWYAILIGIPILLWATRGLLRALVVVHRLVWGDPRGVTQKATPGRTLRFLVLVLLYFPIRELAAHVESWSGSSRPEDRRRARRGLRMVVARAPCGCRTETSRGTRSFPARSSWRSASSWSRASARI